MPALSALPSLAIAGVLLVGGHQVIQGDLTLGDFVAVNAYLLLLVMPLRMIGMWVGQYQRAMAVGERIFEVLDEERDIVEQPDARPAARRRRARCGSRTSRSPTRRAARCSRTST